MRDVWMTVIASSETVWLCEKETDAMAQLIKKIRTERGYYVYDTWTNEILEVDRSIFHLLPDSAPVVALDDPPTPTEHGPAMQAIESARKDGYFRADLPVVSSFPESLMDRTIQALLEKGPDHLILNITERCNLRCRYCSFSGAYEDNRSHSSKVMSPEVIDAALRWYFGFRGRRELSLGFYGGEPLTDLSLLKYAVEVAKHLAPGSVKFRLTTNATMLTEEACRFLIQHDFRLNVSLDGPREVHDRYRVFPDGRGSFDAAWDGLMRLYRMDPGFFGSRVSFNVVAAAPIRLREIGSFMAENPDIFQDHSVTVSRVNPYPSCLSDDILAMETDPSYPRQKAELFGVFRDKMLTGRVFPEDFVLSFFKSDFMDVHQRVMSDMKETTPSNGQCVPGDPKCFVGTGGDLYMCERVGSSRPIGSVGKGFDTGAIVQIMRDYDAAFKERCAHCWAIRFCSKCFVTVRHGENFSENRIEAFCRATRNRWHWVLQHYCEIRESREDAFGWCSEIA